MDYPPPEIYHCDKVELLSTAFKIDSWGLGVILYKTFYNLFPELDPNKEVSDAVDLDLTVPEGHRLKRGWLSSIYNDLDSLVQGLLHPVAAKRMSIIDAINHPWF